MSHKLPIPREIEELRKEGIWPRDEDSQLRQNLHSPIPERVIREFAPEESSIYFDMPPFATVRQLMEGAEKGFWRDPRSAVTEIDPDLTLLIGDFGLGSDAPIALDYRQSQTEPRVIRLRWDEKGNHWVQVARTFTEFARCLRRKHAAG